jgi:gas vesicle protein
MDETGYKKNGATNFLVGMVIGLAVGAGISLLYAPKTGADTRAMIKEKAKKISDNASETFNKAKSKIAEMRGKAEEKAEEMHSKASSI